MKIAIVSAFPPSKVTLNEYAYHLVKNMVQNPVVSEIKVYSDVHVSKAQLAEMGITEKVVVEKVWGFNNPLNCLKIANKVRKEKPDGVLYNLQFMKFGDQKISAAMGLLSPMLTKIMGVPTVSLLHNIMETVDLDSAGFTQNAFLKNLYSKIGEVLTQFILASDQVTVTMQKYVDILTEKYRTENVSLIPHGTFEVSQKPEFAEQKTKKQVMTFGKFGTYKKVEILIDACEMIRARNKDLDFEIVIAGTDNPNVPGYLEGVEQSYSDTPDIRFTGYVEEEDVPRIFNEADAVVFPYTSTTGSSGVLHQAGSYGKAAIMPSLGDLADLVTDEGYVAEFFDPTDAKDLSEAIEKILIDDNYRHEIGMKNYQAANAYPMTDIADMYVDTFSNIIHAKNGKLAPLHF